MDCSSYNSLVTAAGEDNIPIGAIFELTHRCNLRCTHCYLHDYTGRGELSTQEWKTVISDFAGLGGLWLAFTGGEIFLRRDLFELIEHARSSGFALKLLTNALLMDDEKIRRLADLWPAEVHVSIYAADPKLHDQVTLMDGSWETSIGAIRKMREYGLSVTLKTPIMSCNLRDIPALQELADSMGAALRLDTDIMPKNDCSKSPLSHRLSDSELDELFKLPQMSYRLPPPGAQAPPLDNDLCGAARRTFCVTPVGDIQPCLTNPVSGGNVRDDTLHDIWNYSPLMLRYRGYRVSDLAEECIKCEHRPYCGRCSAMASLEDGNYLGKSGWACRVSEARKRAAEAAANPDASATPATNSGFVFIGEISLNK